MVKTRRSQRVTGALTVLVAAIMLAQVPLVLMDDASEAADAPLIQNPAVRIYNQNSSDYSALAYLSDKLPSQFSATEWVYSDTLGVWHNVNSTGDKYGYVLKYGDVVGVTASEIRSDILAKFSSVFTGTDFVILQVDYLMIGDCNVGIEILKDSTSVFSELTPITKEVSGAYIDGNEQHSHVLSVDTSASADVQVADTRGAYTAVVKYNGTSAGSVTVDYGGSICHLGGAVKDSSNREIPNAAVAYTVSSSTGSVIGGGTVTTDYSGLFTIDAEYGTIVTINSITSTGFTFNLGASGYSYGTVSGDISPGPTFNSAERYLRIIILDQSDRPAQGVSLSALWYTSTPEGTGYNITTSDEGLGLSGNTDAAGVALVTVTSIPADAKLLIRGIDGPNSYTFEVDPISAGSRPTPLPATVTEEGNAYADTSTFADIGLKAKEHSIVVTTAGSTDAMLEGGSALPSVRVMADWYYQIEEAADDYKIRTFDTLGTGFADLVRGTVWSRNMYTGQDGTILLCYTVPEWDPVAPGESAYLYVYSTGAAGSSPSRDYTYSYEVPADGEKSVTEIADAHKACSALASGSVSNTTLRTEEVSYTINGTITGDTPGIVPDSVKVFCTTSGFGDSKTVSPVAGVISFSFPVKSGSVNKIEIDDTPGYTFSVKSQTMPTASSDLNFTSVATAEAEHIDRDDAVVIGTYTVNNLTAGDMLTFKYTVSGVEYTVKSRAASATDVFDIYGWSGNVASSVSVTGVNIYISEFSGNTATAAKMVQREFITYYNESSDKPSTGDVVGGQTIQILCDGKAYQTIVTDENGKATVTVPDTTGLTLKYGSLTVTAAQITEGAYTGYYGINMKDVINDPFPKDIKITVRYVATSSLQNVSEVKNVDVLNSPFDISVTVGEKKQFVAPDLDGFEFSGWFINGTKVSAANNIYYCELQVTEDMDNSVLTASYSAVTPDPPKGDVGPIIAAGILSVTLSMIALIIVIMQKRRY